MIDQTHEPNLTSWVESANAPGAVFPIQNLPYASFLRAGETRPRLGVGIGDQLLDITEAFGIESLRLVMAMEKAARVALRARISSFLSEPQAGGDSLLIPIAGTRFTLPCPIGDYTDFYASIDHATHVGRLMRPDHPLLPNYKWLPVAYHGRASSIVLSGAPVRRPWGEMAEGPASLPVFAPTRRLDYEVELGAFLGPGNRLGEPIPPAQAAEHLVGVTLLNDWSARDIQSWEYQPLGPFLAKNFVTTISPWVIPMEALEPFRRATPMRLGSDPEPLPHLQCGLNGAFSITLEAWLKTPAMSQPVRLSHSDFALMYWTLEQMVAHHASNGCPIRPGRFDRQRHGIGAGEGKSRLSAGTDQARRRTAGLAGRPNAQVSGRRRRSDSARVLRGAGIQADRAGQLPRRGTAGGGAVFLETAREATEHHGSGRAGAGDARLLAQLAGQRMDVNAFRAGKV